MSGKGGILGISSYEETRKRAAWNKATATFSLVLDTHRIDCDGRMIAWDEYGQYTECGWHIDHAYPSALGGSDELHNLRARHWRGNCGAGASISALGRIFGKATSNSQG